jgi:hypothetical protein
MILLEPNFLLAYILVTIIGIYILNLPTVITGETAIVREYYYKGWKTYLPIDLLLVFAYFLVAEAIWNAAGITRTSGRLVVLTLVTIALTGGWCWWFTSRPQTGTFFSRWFHLVGWQAVLFDVVLLGLIYLLYASLPKMW